MCGRTYARHGMRFVGPWGHHGRKRHGRRGDYFGVDAATMSPGAQLVAAAVVLVPVALSGVILAFTPVWWIFTTYFWVAFPAVGLLVRGVAGLAQTGDTGPARAAAADSERELLLALRRHGELTSVGVASETSLSVAEAERKLRALAEGGHLDVRVSGGGIFYALWETGPDARLELPARATSEEGD